MAVDDRELSTEVLSRLRLCLRDLSAAGTPTAEVLAGFVTQATSAFAADGGALFELGEHGQVGVLAAHGYDEELIVAFQPMSVMSAYPVTDAIRLGEPVIVSSAAETVERYPGLTGNTASRDEASISYPLRWAGETVGALGLSFTGARRWSVVEQELLEAWADTASLLLAGRRLAHQATGSVGRQRAWAEFATRLCAAATVSEVVDVARSHGPPVLDAQHVLVADAVGNGRLRVHGCPWAPAGTGGTLDVDTGSSNPLADAFRNGAPVLLPDPATAARRYPTASADRAAAGIRSSIAVPMEDADAAAVGSVMVAWLSERSLDGDTVAAVQAVAALVGRALRRAAVVEQLDRQSSSAVALADLAGALVGASSRTAVAREVVLRARTVVEAASAEFAVVNRAGDGLTVLHHDRLPTSLAARHATQPLHRPTPHTDAHRSGETVLVASLDECERRYPHLCDDLVARGLASVAALPIRDRTGAVQAVVGFVWDHPQDFDEHTRAALAAVADMCAQTLRVITLRERERRLAADAAAAKVEAVEARRGAEAARERLALLFEITERAGRSLHPAQVSRELSEALVGRFSDGCAVYLPGPSGLERAGVLKTGADLPQDLLIIPPDAPVPVAAAYRSGRTCLAPITDEVKRLHDMSPQMRAADAANPTHTLLAVPAMAGGEVIAVLQFGAAGERNPFDAEDVALAEEIAARAAVPLANASRYRREHDLAELLQRAILPEHVPRLEGIALDAHYRSASARVTVGGDWYDAFPVGVRSVVALGDVMGKGVVAATVMSEVRNALRSYAIVDPRPEAVLAALRRFVDHFDQDTLVTVAYALVDPVAGTATVAHAGHPPALVVDAGGRTRWVPGRGPVLGAVTSAAADESAVVTLAPGDRIYLYSDGLVESRDISLDAGMDRLARHLSGQPGIDLGALVGSLAPQRDDDVSIVSVRLDLSPA